MRCQLTVTKISWKRKKEVCAEKRSDAKNKRNWYATLSREKKQKLLSKKMESYAKKRKLMIDCENSSSNFSNRPQNIAMNDGDHIKLAGKIVENEFYKRKLVKFRNS